MDSTDLSQLSRRERQIMDLLFEHGSLTAQQVTDLLDDAPSYTTVRTLLRRLEEEKKYIQHTKLGRQFVYAPVSPKEQVRQRSLQHMLKTFFKGSISEAVATFLSDPDTQLTEEELAELENLINNAKK